MLGTGRAGNLVVFARVVFGENHSRTGPPKKWVLLERGRPQLI